jgi:hypothetical protein
MPEPEQGKLQGARNGVQEVCRNNVHCAGADLIKMANTPYEKEVAINIIGLHEKCDNVNTNMKWLKYLSVTLNVTILSTLLLIIKVLLTKSG